MQFTKVKIANQLNFSFFDVLVHIETSKVQVTGRTMFRLLIIAHSYLYQTLCDLFFISQFLSPWLLIIKFINIIKINVGITLRFYKQFWAAPR